MRDKILGRVNVFVPLIATVFVNVAIDEAVDEGLVSARLLDQRVPLDGVPFGKPVYQQPRFQQ